MTEFGVNDIAIYIPPFYLSHEDLAKARGVPAEKYLDGLGNHKISIIPNWEDAVTMAANAAIQLLEKTGTDPNEIQQLVVSTESGVDHSKPVASFVQGALKIGSRCRVYEIKHACYGGTAGLINSIDWVSQNHNSQKKALVIMSDIARYAFGSPGESTQGAGAVALLVEKNPRLFSMNTSLNGIFSQHVFDFWRPTGHRVPIVDGKYSIECYLRALEGAYTHLLSNLGIEKGRFFERVDYLIYHMPFGNMAKKAHCELIDLEYDGLNPAAKEQIFAETFPRMVEPSLLGVREVGNIYTGSVYMGLISLLETEGEKVEGKQVGIFSYGSGCGAEFFLCRIKTGIRSILEGLRFKEQLDRRKKINFETYVQTYSKSGEETLYHPAESETFKDSFTRFVFTGFRDHKRQYL